VLSQFTREEIDNSRSRRCVMKDRLTLGKTSVALGLGLLVLISGCTVGPDYKRPITETPAHYKSEELGSWKQGEPLDRVPRGSWWEVFGDEILNDLERRSTGANQELKAALARVEQARATARIVSSELLPTLSADPSWNRQRYSPNQEPSFGAITATTVSVPLDLSYEVDLWGRVRRGFESARAETQASLASYYSVLLTLHADVARTYFAVRALDAEIVTVSNTVALRQEQVQLVQSRFEGGIGNELDVARAQTELATAEAEGGRTRQAEDRIGKRPGNPGGGESSGVPAGCFREISRQLGASSA
jgi:multidrug efflux system outer membrane protein